MFRKVTATCLPALPSHFAIQTAGAQNAPTPRSAFLDGMQSSVTKSLSAQDKTVEITLTGSVLTVCAASASCLMGHRRHLDRELINTRVRS